MKSKNGIEDTRRHGWLHSAALNSEDSMHAGIGTLATSAARTLAAAVLLTLFGQLAPSAHTQTIAAAGFRGIARPPLDVSIRFHLAKLAEAQDSYGDHLSVLEEVEIATASEELDTEVAEKVAQAMEADGRTMTDHAQVLAAFTTARFARWTKPLARESELAWGTAMALRSLFTSETPLERRQEVMEVRRHLRLQADDLERLRGGLEQDLALNGS